MGVVSLGEDVNLVYGANASDPDHADFIGFASRDVLAGETFAVLQGPRVSGLSAVYGPLTDASEYFLTDAGGISLIPGTVSVRLGDSDGTDTLVGLNAPFSPPPVQSATTVTSQIYTPAYNSYNLVTAATPGGDVTLNFPTAVGNNGAWIKVKKFTGEDVRRVTMVGFG